MALAAIDEAVLTMRVGEKACIIAAPDYAYGAEGFPDWGVLPNSPVKFEIELLHIDGGMYLVWDHRHQLRKKRIPFQWKLRSPYTCGQKDSVSRKIGKANPSMLVSEGAGIGMTQ